MNYEHCGTMVSELVFWQITPELFLGSLFADTKIGGGFMNIKEIIISLANNN